MRAAEKIRSIRDALAACYGPQRCPLEHASAFQLLAAVMLSAQCTDAKVNQVTAPLFAAYPDAAAMALAPVERIEAIIRPAGLFRAKSRNLRAAAEAITGRFGGAVPQTMEELLTLPGIGRKSANVVLGNAFGIPGFPADTHVQRVLTRLGIIARRDPELAESTVCRHLEPEFWTEFSHLLITHGRRVCSARSPRCTACAVAALCPRKGV